MCVCVYISEQESGRSLLKGVIVSKVSKVAQ